jgi:5-methyltetrahydrofolate--homocysteine methyltransferase
VHTVLRSATREVVIGPDQPFCIIGERINPSGRGRFQEQLARGDLSGLDVDVAEQVAGGAMVLDVNMGTARPDEAALLARAVTRIETLCDLPLCIDSSVVAALEAGLAAYRGRALVNSVSAEDERLSAILPLVRRHGAALVALPIDAAGVPGDPRRRLELARRIVDVATGRFGLSPEDIVIDALALPIGADETSAEVTLETVALIGSELGLNTILGASNVSFGQSGRDEITRAFLPRAMAAGLTSALLDARSEGLVGAVRAADRRIGHAPPATGEGAAGVMDSPRTHE